MSKFKIGDQVKFNGEGKIHRLYSHSGMDISIGGFVMFIPHDAGVTLEKIDPVWDWKDGDVVQSPVRDESLNRRKGAWDNSNPYDDHRYTDDKVTDCVNRHGWRVLRYQALWDQNE